MKKRNVHAVHEHFEELLTQLFDFVAFMKRSRVILRKVRFQYNAQVHDAIELR